MNSLNSKFNNDQFCSLAAVTERQSCTECGRRRMYFCYDCKCYVGQIASIAPRVEQLPLRVDIVKHRHELNSKSTAIHALLISPAQTRIFDTFEQVPNYTLEFCSFENVAVLFPAKNSLSIDQFVRDNGPLHRIVVLDSTWNTVGQLRNMANIVKLPSVHLRRYTTDYWRPQNGLTADHLATIEAIYYACLECREAEANWSGMMKRRRRTEEEGSNEKEEQEKRNGGRQERRDEEEKEIYGGKERRDEEDKEEDQEKRNGGRQERRDGEEKEMHGGKESRDGEDKEERNRNGRKEKEELPQGQDALDNLLFWFYFFRKKVPERIFKMKK